jgi:hypothetical protein
MTTPLAETTPPFRLRCVGDAGSNTENPIPPATAAELANPAAPGGRHHQAVKIACSLIGNGLSGAAVFAELRTKYDDEVSDDELHGIVEWAEEQDFKPSGYRPAKIHRTNAVKRADTSPAGATSNTEAFLKGYHCDAVDVVASGPVNPDNMPASHAVTLLKNLYQPDDLVNIVTEYTEAHSKNGKVKYNPQGYGITKTASEWITEIERDNVPIGAAGVWIRMNPLDGKGIADANVVAHRFALVEFDNISVELQLPFLRRLPVPLAAIITSGGKSIHGWVAVNAGTESEYDKTVAALLALLKPFGVDQSNKNPSRLSRLPGAIRRLGGSGDGRQRLLYCNPEVMAAGPLDLTALREAVKAWHAAQAQSNDQATPDSGKLDALQAALADGRPKIRLPGPNRVLSEFGKELGALLGGKDLYIRNGEVVRLRDVELSPVKPPEFRTLAEQYACFYRIRQAGEHVVEFTITMTNDVSVGVLASPQFLAHLRPIRQVHDCRLPVMRKDGKVELLPDGYDAESRTLTTPVVDYARDMTLSDAIATIRDLYSEFVLADGERSRSVLVAGMLALYGRHLLPPNTDRVTFITTANAEGAGKGLVNSLMILPTMGAVYVGVKAKDEEEMRKVLTTAIRDSDPVVFLDNLKCHLNSHALEAFITADRWKDRLLGANENVKGENLATVFIAGNKLTVSPDIRRRALFIELLLEAERADDRIIRRPLDRAKILTMRPTILAALWALVRHWDEQGRPKPSRIKGGFESWSEIIGGIVEATGFGCPLVAGEVAITSDPDTEDMRRLVEAMAALGSEYSFAGLVDVARKEECFPGILGGEGDPKPDTKARATLARLLAMWDKRMIGNWRLRIIGKGHARRYQVESLHGDTVEHGVSPDIRKKQFLDYRLNTVLDRVTVQSAVATDAEPGVGTETPVDSVDPPACATCGSSAEDCVCWIIGQPGGGA